MSIASVTKQAQPAPVISFAKDNKKMELPHAPKGQGVLPAHIGKAVDKKA